MLFNRIGRRVRWSMTAASALVLTTLGAPALAATDSVAQPTVVGIHNAYTKADFPYLAKALDAGASMVELDAWGAIFTREWKVSHDKPTSNDIKYWLAAHPASGPTFVKVELKAGFQNNYGMGPAAFDADVSSHLGNVLFRPADLLGGHANLDEAAKANAWPSRASLAGKVIMYVIPGTVELGNPTDTLHTDVEYATYMKNLKAAGNLATATTFPAVLGAAGGDPRAQYTDASIRPWFVVFDGDAATYVSGVDTSWYDTNHYLLTMTDAHNVPPALDDTNPPVAEARNRVAQLAQDHASIATCDWYGLPSVLSQVLPRG